ncbi:hypothetical protein JR316_0009147 [Psilocybe cubensis]|uniref:Uncharacterized protein n=1 Tax=Psilocybe cubensis TaxID=181762 RepID=A0ACB8GSY0_PSICU|nr:hypothetical protein JR316_0009147 [Psilocybe cubensis]KAH9478689.1 hypothetical protein JR316_0009147 [Psilocybe cubensis]
MDAKTDTKKPKPRRLFSFDSVKSVTSSRRSSAASSDYEGPKGARPLNPFELSNVQEKDEDDPEGTAQYARRIVEQPMTDAQQDDGSRSPPSTDPFADMQSPTKLEPVRPVPLRAMRSFNSEGQPSTPSPTRARWESLRQHVLPAHIRSMSPPPRPGSAQSSIHGNLPVRSTTPKPSRLARLGFKQVVEQARDMADDTRKLGEEIMRGCAVARYPEMQKSSKENLNHGSTVNLAGVQATGSSRMDYLRRPQSVVSLATTAAGTLGSQGPSLRFLYQILVYHSGPEEHSVSPHLPYESQVLSTLLCPFLTPVKYPGVRLEEETITAMESFELVSRSWTPVDENACVERCLWCCKAASSLSPSVLRTRILGSLWRIIVPGDSNRILLSPQAFRSIVNGLLMLLQPIHPDIGSLQDIIFQYLSGSLGEIEDDQVEETYGVEFGIADRRHMPSVRRAIFLDALVSTIENSGGTGEWLLCNVIELTLGQLFKPPFVVEG